MPATPKARRRKSLDGPNGQVHGVTAAVNAGGQAVMAWHRSGPNGVDVVQSVLRAGLTSKHLDPAGLVRCLDKGMSRLARVIPDQHGFSTEIFSPGLREFALAVTQSSPAEPDGVLLPDAGRRIVMCIGGEVELVNDLGETVSLARGESIFADAHDGGLRVHGLGEVAQAYTPTADDLPGTLTDLV